MSIRMMPMEFVFSRFPRLVYDVSAQLGKKVHLRTQGQETELDKELIELLIDPLTHVVRNAIDHGIESPEERARRRQARDGHARACAPPIAAAASIIEVSDDGRGLDRERILAKARELGMPVDESMTDQEVWGLIFEAGLLHREGGDRPLRARRRHGRGPPQHRLAGRQRLGHLARRARAPPSRSSCRSRSRCSTA